MNPGQREEEVENREAGQHWNWLHEDLWIHLVGSKCSIQGVPKQDHPSDMATELWFLIVKIGKLYFLQIGFHWVHPCVHSQIGFQSGCGAQLGGL